MSVSTISTNRSTSTRRVKMANADNYETSQLRTDPIQTRKRRRSVSSSEDSYTSGSSHDRRRAQPVHQDDRVTRRRRSSISPDNRGRDRDPHHSNGGRRSNSVDKSRIARDRRSLTPDPRDQPSTRDQPRPNGRRRYTNDDERYGGSIRDAGRNADNAPLRKQPTVRKERSLSPFSRRLALTQAMNLGR